MRFAPVFLVVSILLAGSAVGEEPQPIELSLQPRAIETPALKYRLFPTESELKPGNAATILLRLPWEQTFWMKETFPTLDQWESRPLNAPEWKSSQGVLPEMLFAEIERAAFRREASWEYPIRETPSPYLMLLPDVQGLRGFLGAGLSGRIRYHLSRGELDEARQGILVGLANSRHLAQTPFYVNQLVALEIDRTLLRRADELISQPNSPNLYWALSTLPDSLLELERAGSFEGDMFAMTFPAVHDLDSPRDAAQWSKMARQLVEFLEMVEEIPPQEQPSEKGSPVAQILQLVKPAEMTHVAKVVRQVRAELPRMLEIPAATVAAMSDDEAFIRWYVHLRMAGDQHAAAILSLSPREAWPQFKRLREEREAMQKVMGAKSPDVLRPISVYVSVWSLKRKIAALRIIEAVRHYLATHSGQFPETLDEIKEVAIPIDPLSGEPFQWNVAGQTAMLTAPPLPADVVPPASTLAATSALEYRLQVK